MAPEITCDPLPPTQGDSANIGWTGTYPKVLNITWTPPGAGPATIEITSANGTLLPIPSNAVGVKFTDPNGVADALATVINAP